MILALSTSSAYVVVALTTSKFDLVQEHSALANRNASGSLIRLMEALRAESGFEWTDIESIIVDLGPGSFSGVKVGATMAKVWAELAQLPIYGVGAHDLYSPDQTVAIEHRKGSYYVRKPGQSVISVDAEPSDADLIIRQGSESQVPTFRQIRDGALVGPFDAVTLVPNYVLEPSISKPNQPFPQLGSIGVQP